MCPDSFILYSPDITGGPRSNKSILSFLSVNLMKVDLPVRNFLMVKISHELRKKDRYKDRFEKHTSPI